MALKYATVSAETNKIKGSAIYEAEETKSSPGAGDTFLLENESGGFRTILVSLLVTAGTGKIQYAISSRSKVLAGTATWFDWSSGVVSANTNDTLYHVSAIRQVNFSGTTVLEARWV